jgi:hypothetical protein
MNILISLTEYIENKFFDNLTIIQAFFSLSPIGKKKILSGETTKLQILEKKNVYKAGNSMFQLDELYSEFNNEYLVQITSILEKGLKFVPCTHTDIEAVYTYMVCSIDNNLPKFDTRLFIDKMNNRRKNMGSSLNSTNISTYKANTTCDSLECILKQLKDRRVTCANRDLLRESPEMRLQLFENMSKSTYSFEANLSPKQKKFLRKYVKEKPFSIIQCEKNIGLCILSNKLLDEIVLGTLNNRDWNDAYARATLC